VVTAVAGAVRVQVENGVLVVELPGDKRSSVKHYTMGDAVSEHLAELAHELELVGPDGDVECHLNAWYAAAHPGGAVMSLSTTEATSPALSSDTAMVATSTAYRYASRSSGPPARTLG
jgi:hypothetical protein